MNMVTLQSRKVQLAGVEKVRMHNDNHLINLRQWLPTVWIF